MREFCHGLSSLFLPVGAGRPGVALRHASVGVAKRPCHGVPNDTGAYTPTASAPSCAETLCGPHHQAALRRLCARQRPPPRGPLPSATAHRARAGTPPPGGHLGALLPKPTLYLSRLGRLGESPCQWPS